MKKLYAINLLVIIWTVTFSQTVLSTTFNVNLFVVDAVDINPGDGVCRINDSSNLCTLRAAVMEANALAGVDIIAIPADAVVKLSIGAGGSDSSPSSNDLDISESVLIVGGDDNTTPQDFPVIDAINFDSRIFDVRNANQGGITFRRLKLINGDVEDHPVSHSGGAVRVVNSLASIVFDHIWFFNNKAFDGGALAVHSSEAVSITNSVLQLNSSENNGSGIYAEDSQLTIKQSSFYSNLANSGTFQEVIYLIKENQVDASAELSNVSLFGFADGNGDKTGINARGVDLTLNHTTVSYFGDVGVRVVSNGFTPEIRLENSMLVDNNEDCDWSFGDVSIVSKGTFFTDSSCIPPPFCCDLILDDSGLGPMATDEDFWQFFRSADIDSPAIDSADLEFCAEVDQLGKPRPVDGNNIDDSSECDRGAIENYQDLIFKNGFGAIAQRFHWENKP